MSSSSSWNPGMISIEAELQAVERDFFSGKCGAFETADAQQEVAQQLSSLKGLENQLFAQSRALWDWSAEEQGLWQNAMHRQQQQSNGNSGATPSPGMMGQQHQQQQQMNGADQLALLFAKRDQSLKQICETVNSLTKSISTCCDVVSRGGGGNSNNRDNSKNNSNNNNNTATGNSKHNNSNNDDDERVIKTQNPPSTGNHNNERPKNPSSGLPSGVKPSSTAVNRSPGLGPQNSNNSNQQQQLQQTAPTNDNIIAAASSRRTRSNETTNQSNKNTSTSRTTTPQQGRTNQNSRRSDVVG